MIKRSTAYLYILLTSFVLLAHAVIPHHHHESDIFIVNSDCKTDNGVHKHGTTEHKHEGHDENNVENCIIQQVVEVRSNQVRYEFKSFDQPNKYLHFEGLQVDSFIKGLNLPFPTIFSNLQASLLSSSYSTFARTSLGLRAPPQTV